jgi:hypothetical protein
MLVAAGIFSILFFVITILFYCNILRSIDFHSAFFPGVACQIQAVGFRQQAVGISLSRPEKS